MLSTISHLTCEYQTNPLGIDVRQPRLSWQMQSDRRGARQAAYQIFAAPSETSLKSNTGLLWDSGKVESDQSIHVPYNGPLLTSGQRVYWKVRVWDETGQEIESPSAWWEWAYLNVQIGKRNGLALLFSADRERPVLFPIFAKNLHFKKR